MAPFYRWSCLTAEPVVVVVPALQCRRMCGAFLKCYTENIQCGKKGSKWDNQRFPRLCSDITTRRIWREGDIWREGEDG